MTPSPDPTEPWASSVILRTEVGSTAHGTGLPDQEDYDELGVYVPPWQEWIGLPAGGWREQTIVYRPGRAPTERSGPGDYDLTLHSPRKFAQLAAGGNPSILMALYGPVRFETELGRRLLDIRGAFWSQRARQPFLGYALAQRQRLTGERGGAHTNRPELVAEHGYDTKYAMHMLRLGLQGIEYMSCGYITLPMVGSNAQFLRSVRRGEVPLETVLMIAEENERALRFLESPAPPEPDLAAINAWLAEAYDYSQIPR